MDKLSREFSSLHLIGMEHILNLKGWAYLDCSFAGFDYPSPIHEISFLIKNLPTSKPFSYVIQKPHVPFETRVQSLTYRRTGIPLTSGSHSLEYVSNMLVDMCEASGTDFIFVKDIYNKEAATALCHFANRRPFVPTVINLATEGLLQVELTKFIAPNFSACCQHDSMRSDVKWYCTQVHVLHMFNKLNCLAS